MLNMIAITRIFPTNLHNENNFVWLNSELIYVSRQNRLIISVWKSTQERIIDFPGISMAKPQVALDLCLYSWSEVIDLKVRTVSVMQKALRKYCFCSLSFFLKNISLLFIFKTYLDTCIYKVLYYFLLISEII